MNVVTAAIRSDVHTYRRRKKRRPGFVETDVDLKGLLVQQKLLGTVTLPAGIDALLQAAQIDGATSGSAPITGNAKLGSPTVPVVGLQIGPFGPDVPFTLQPKPAAGTVFSLLLDLTKVSGASAVLSTPIPGLQAAKRDGATGAMTVLADPTVTLTGAGVSVLIEGPDGGAATLSLSSKTDLEQPDKIVAIGLSQTPVLLGDTGVGLDLPKGLLLDLSKVAAPVAPAPTEQIGVATMPSTVPGWRGLVVRAAQLYLPSTLPGVGDATGSLDFDIGIDPAGIALVSVLDIPEKVGSHPKITVRVECVDPSATGLDGLKPTLVEMALVLPVGGTTQDLVSKDDGTQTLILAGDPVTVRMRLARAAATGNGTTRLTAALERTGTKGLLEIRSVGPGAAAAKWAIAAAGFATALVANEKLKPGQTRPAPGGMAELMAGGAVLAALLADDGSDLLNKGRLAVNAVELDSSGPGLALDQDIQFKLDYSVDVPIRPLNVGVLSITLDPTQLLRIRLRNVTVGYNRSKTGLDRFSLDVTHATMDIEDPGKWLVGGPGSLFDVVGTRSGRGSTWIEVDLRFKLDLGPLKVSGATIRATVGDKGAISVGLRGLDASFELPKVVTMSGGLTLGPAANGFSAQLAVGIVPLNLAASAWLSVQGKSVLVRLVVDLPAPIPLGPTGFGLFGIAATFGINAALAFADQTPLGLLKWENKAAGFAEKAGSLSFGAQASIGTLPDMSFSVGAKAGLFLSLPDFDIIGALDAQFLSGPVSLAKVSKDSQASGGTELIVQGAARPGCSSG